MYELKCATGMDWVERVLADFDHFLLDHAACERKASATGMWFVAHYPDKPHVVAPMIELALEELEHFQQVWHLCNKRGLKMGPDEKDPYINHLLKHVRKGTDNYLLDRLLIFSVVERRGYERFNLLGQHLEGELADFYIDIGNAEARHFSLFLQIARKDYPQEVIEQRLEEILEIEAEALELAPKRAVVH